MGEMRIVGKRLLAKVGLRGPTKHEILTSIDSSKRAPSPAPKGIYRYRTHADANAAMETVDGMVGTARKLDSQGAEERDLQTGSEGSRKATWPDVFFLIEKLEKHRAEYVLIGGSKA
jgi:hypothetical protein